MTPVHVGPSSVRAGTRLAALAGCALVLGLSAPGAFAATVRGTLRVPSPPHDEPAFHPYAGRATSMVCAARSPRGLPVDAVVYLESIPAAVDSTLPAVARPKLAQKDQSFAPRVVAVPVGGAVDFPNLDPIYHNVFSVSPIRRFDLGKYPRGESRTVRFPKAGLVNVYCDIHSDMAAFVLVLPNRAYARPRADGTWQLPDVPPGRYTLCWWHPDFPPGKRDLEVGAAGETVADVSFAP
jgi:plastocyanin